MAWRSALVTTEPFCASERMTSAHHSCSGRSLSGNSSLATSRAGLAGRLDVAAGGDEDARAETTIRPYRRALIPGCGCSAYPFSAQEQVPVFRDLKNGSFAASP